jgi:hypothetical protein
MNKKMKLVAGMLLFGSLWGFSEVIIGSTLGDMGLPSGVLMTAFFAMTFMVMSRMIYRQPGMQMGMGLIAGSLRMFNPFMGCHLCSALAIMAEGVLFELIWYFISDDFHELKNTLYQGSMGIITAYILYTGGSIVTQILTPIVDVQTFFIEDLIGFIPNILAKGLLAGLAGVIVIPIIFAAKQFTNIKIRDTLYYPTTIGISLFCWITVVGNWLILTG